MIRQLGILTSVIMALSLTACNGTEKKRDPGWLLSWSKKEAGTEKNEELRRAKKARLRSKDKLLDYERKLAVAKLNANYAMKRFALAQERARLEKDGAPEWWPGSAEWAMNSAEQKLERAKAEVDRAEQRLKRAKRKYSE